MIWTSKFIFSFGLPRNIVDSSVESWYYWWYHLLWIVWIWEDFKANCYSDTCLLWRPSCSSLLNLYNQNWLNPIDLKYNLYHTDVKVNMFYPIIRNIITVHYNKSYGSWIFNYLCNQCLSPLMLWVRIPLRQGLLITT